MNNNIEINKKSLLSYPNYLKNIFSVISFNKEYNIVGSSSIRGLLFSLDYDLNMHLLEYDEPVSHVYSIFHELFEKLSKNPNIYFMDFKANELHWTLKELLRGYKIVRSKKHSLKDSLADTKHIIKLDIVARLNYADLVDITMIYNIDYKQRTLDEHHTIIVNTLKNDFKADIHDYLKEGNYFKALKRLFRLYNLNHEVEKLGILFHLFNSDLGVINKTKSNIDLFHQVLEKYDLNIDEIKFSLQTQKDFLNNIMNPIFLKHVFEKIDEICNLKNVKTFKSEIQKLYLELNHILQKETKKWIDLHKSIKKDLEMK